jgi:hypothetical protein
MDAMNHEEQLAAGAAILGTRLAPLGFTFAVTSSGPSAGGPYAAGAFTRGRQALSFSVRHGALGLVTYHFGDQEWTHAEMMRAVQRPARYPGFSDGDRLGGFRRLLADLEGCDAFFATDGSEVAEAVRALPPKPKGFRGLA